MIEVERTIISQYGTTATISQLIRNMDAYIDPRTNFDEFYDFVWNVDTARGFGLDIWGRIVDISRSLVIPADVDYFGFSQASPTIFPFNEGVFYDRTQTFTQTFLLTDDAYRQLILVKALSNISATNAPSVNQLLRNMFEDRGRAYVNDLGGMAIRYVFEFDLTPYEFAIVTQSGAFPRPAGVQSSMIVAPAPVFGFQGSELYPFNEGTFISRSSTHVIS
jgi:hypothetical protein